MDRSWPSSGVPVPYLETATGAIWWAVGTSALAGGTGTVVLAAGLGLTGVLASMIRNRHGRGEPLPPGGRGRLLRSLGVTAGLIAAVSTLLGTFGWGEAAVPAACVLCGIALVPLSSLLDRRSTFACGAALMVLGALGAFLAFSTVGTLYPVGVVGLAAGALLWLAGAYRAGLLDDLQARARH